MNKLYYSCLNIVSSYHNSCSCKCFQDNASSLKAQLDQQRGVVDTLVSNTRVGCFTNVYNYVSAVFVLDFGYLQLLLYGLSPPIKFFHLLHHHFLLLFDYRTTFINCPPIINLYRLVLLNGYLVWQLLESKIQEAKSKKDTLKARAQSAKFVLPLH